MCTSHLTIERNRNGVLANVDVTMTSTFSTLSSIEFEQTMLKFGFLKVERSSFNSVANVSARSFVRFHNRMMFIGFVTQKPIA